MKLRKILRTTFSFIPAILFFSGGIFLSAHYAQFIVSTHNVDVTLGSLESSNNDFNISIDPAFEYYTEGEVPYRIATDSHCNQYDDDWNCVDPVPDLCPYISIEPINEESTEISSTQSPSTYAEGELNNPIDEIDRWNLVVKSPCFEGECPADSDEEESGVALPQSSKGQTFKCSLEVQATDTPPLVENYLTPKIAKADTSLNSIEVSAVLTGETVACVSNCFSNVLFLPGLKASRLYTPRANGSEDQLWEPNGNSDVEDLYLNTNGTSKNSDIYTRDIIKETNVPIPAGPTVKNIYKSFSDAMDQLVSDETIKEWQSFAYDWRQSPEVVVSTAQKYEEGTTLSLVPLLKVLEKSSKNGKVTIIAHSNGGLVAKALLKKLQDDKLAGINDLIDKVDLLILVAVPEIGTAKAVPAMLHGYNESILGGWIIDETHARELGRNMLGAFGLLPSKEYVNRVSASSATFVDNATPSQVSTKLVQAFGSAINSYAEYKSFLFGGEGRVNPLPAETNLPISLSQSLFTKAENLHKSIDAFTPPASLRVIEVAGWGLDTVASFEYYPKQQTCPPGASTCPQYVLDERPRFTSDGDGTVVVPSAHFMSFLGYADSYWLNLFAIKNKKHSNILEVNTLLDFISNTITKLPIDNSPYLSTAVPQDNSNRLRLSIHSPVTLDAYDVDGNRTGKICPPTSDFCYAEENIPNSSYMEFGEGKYISIPEDQLKSVKLQGTDIGTFTYDSEKVLPNGTSTTSSFVDIPVTTQTQAEITLNSNTKVPQMTLDVTGDGVTDFTLAPVTIFDPITYLQIMKATIDSLDLPSAKIKAFDTRVDNIIKSIQKGKIDKAKLKADRFKSVLEKKLAKPDPKHPKPKKLSKTDAQLLLDMLNTLLDNIG